ncbi:MAG: hydrogenase iron-sulfur subunit [Armatimonadota bacterium]
MSKETTFVEEKVQEQRAEESLEETRTWQPVILGILCNWCSYAGADLAGSSRLQYPETIRIVRVPCSGRVDPAFVLKAFRRGFDGVMVLGCHPGDCHYAKGNYYARRRIALLQDLLKALGLPEERFHFEWVSASEGNRFAELVQEFTEKIRKLGPFKGVVRSVDN